MKLFRYKAMDASGRFRHGRLPAASEADLEANLRRMGLDLVTCRTVRPDGPAFGRHRITRRELIDFCFQLEQVARTGVPLLQGLEELGQGLENPRFREIVVVVLDRIRQGMTLSQALETFPRVFDAVFTNVVRVGEQSGELSAVLRDLGENLKWQDELHARAKRAAMYPAFVAVVVTGATGFLMVYLVPQLAVFITQMEGELPAATRALLLISAVFVGYWPLFFGLPLAAWAVIALGPRAIPPMQLWLDRLTLHAWFLGEMVRKTILARFATVFALMYRAGVPILEILEVTARTGNNLVFEQALIDVRRRIGEGDRVSTAFAATGLFPTLVVRMVAVGERTGELDGALLNVAYFYRRDVDERIDRLEAIVEPALTIALGTLLGWIMLSVLGPVYDIVSRIAA